MTSMIVSPETRGTTHHLVVHEHLLKRRFVGPMDHLSAEGILALLPQLPIWPTTVGDRNSRIRGATTILNWLFTAPARAGRNDGSPWALTTAWAGSTRWLPATTARR